MDELAVIASFSNAILLKSVCAMLGAPAPAEEELAKLHGAWALFLRTESAMLPDFVKQHPGVAALVGMNVTLAFGPALAAVMTPTPKPKEPPAEPAVSTEAA